MHFTPTSGSWLNMVEILFGIITRQAIRRGTFASVKNLVGAICTFIDGWNERCGPFIWTKPADDLIRKAIGGKTTSLARHWRHRRTECLLRKGNAGSNLAADAS